jgi:hypothetical protein
MTLLVDVVLLGFAIVGLFRSVWSWRVRLALTLGFIVGDDRYGHPLSGRRQVHLPAAISLPASLGHNAYPGRRVIWTQWSTRNKPKRYNGSYGKFELKEETWTRLRCTHVT